MGELFASSRRSSSSVLRLRISWSRRVALVVHGLDRQLVGRHVGFLLAGQQGPLEQQCLLQHGRQRDLGREASRQQVLVIVAQRLDDAACMGSEVLPAACRFSNVVLRVPETSSCKASSLVSYSSWISGVSPTPGHGLGLGAGIAGALYLFPETRVAHSVACCGDVQVWQDRLAQLAGAMEDVSVTLRR